MQDRSSDLLVSLKAPEMWILMQVSVRQVYIKVQSIPRSIYRNFMCTKKHCDIRNRKELLFVNYPVHIKSTKDFTPSEVDAYVKRIRGLPMSRIC